MIAIRNSTILNGLFLILVQGILIAFNCGIVPAQEAKTFRVAGLRVQRSTLAEARKLWSVLRRDEGDPDAERWSAAIGGCSFAVESETMFRPSQKIALIRIGRESGSLGACSQLVIGASLTMGSTTKQLQEKVPWVALVAEDSKSLSYSYI